MSHSHLCCLMHIVFSTDQRRPLIRNEIKIRLHAYLGGIARENAMVALAVGGIEDHVHLLVSLNRTIAVAKAVQLLKAGSSKWINDSFPEYETFSWQEGYGAFSVSISQRDRTAAYIHNQVEHHKKFDFAEEFRRLLAAHGMQEEEFVSRP
ncbi:MAG: IS200/IS605 family transposase [Acidobacteriia bacterium]|nr:IS200/IS605 family transposase [Terriglobia bacterium]